MTTYNITNAAELQEKLDVTGVGDIIEYGTYDGPDRISITLRGQVVAIWGRVNATVQGYGSISVRNGVIHVEQQHWVPWESRKNRLTVHATNRALVEVHTHYGCDVLAEDSVHVYSHAATTRVEARDRVSVDANGGLIVAGGESFIEVRDDARVHAHGTAVVHAYGGDITATARCVVYRHTNWPEISGDGHVIDVTKDSVRGGEPIPDRTKWAALHGVQVRPGAGPDGQDLAVLYKAVGDNYTTGVEWDRPTVWTVGATVVAEDWEPDNWCGHGLHLSPYIDQAVAYHSRATKFLRCVVPLDEVYPIGENNTSNAKCKVRSVLVEAEVDRFGQDLPTTDGTDSTDSTE